ncbi:MAG: DUF4240 domain-containing protein [Rhodobacteraceae bacterium]|nr:DUF4240 domain-containing protein [Paracoccaceae bacterium]
MSQDKFWEIIELTISEDQDEQAERLKTTLEALNLEQIRSFQKHLDEVLHKVSYTWDLWAAAYIINSGASDDSFEYFRAWLISRGKAIFDTALKDPESLIGLSTPYETEFESFIYIANDIHEARAGEVALREGQHPKEPEGEQWDEDTVHTKYPKLAAWVEQFDLDTN